MEENEEVMGFPNFDPTKNLSLAPQQRRKRGLGARPLLQSEIKDIQKGIIQYLQKIRKRI